MTNYYNNGKTRDTHTKTNAVATTAVKVLLIVAGKFNTRQLVITKANAQKGIKLFDSTSCRMLWPVYQWSTCQVCAPMNQ